MAQGPEHGKTPSGEPEKSPKGPAPWPSEKDSKMEGDKYRGYTQGRPNVPGLSK